MTAERLTPRAFVDFQWTHELVAKGDRVLLAVSGGMDSMVMADLFLKTMAELRIELAIAHVNHGLRRSADRDERFVRAYAKKNRLPFYFSRVDVKGLAFRDSRSVEDAARQLRYAFLEEAASAGDYSTIATAHHMNDQAETILMRILKGTGLEGLAGIRIRNGRVIRPLLSFTRAQIENYARLHRIRFNEDPTNRSSLFLRNRLRHDVMPMIHDLVDPQAERHLAELASIVQGLLPSIQNEAERALESIAKKSGTKILLDIKGFNRYLDPHKFFIVQRILRLSDPLAKTTQLDSASYKLISRLLSSQSGKKATVGSVHCYKNRQFLVFESALAQKSKPTWSVTTLPESTGLGPQLGKSKTVEFIDGDKVQGRLAMRSWRTGDRFQPIGLQGSKLLSDFFIDCKVPLYQKQSVPVIVDRGPTFERIVWVCGYRLDHRYRLTAKTTKVLKLECSYDPTSDKN